MKQYKLIYKVLFTLLILGSCKQEVIQLKQPDGVLPPPQPSAGPLSFTKFVAIGNSFVAGMQGGALFTEGQNNSLAAILHTQFITVGGSASFSQPSINSTLGYNIFISPNPGPDGHVLGRMLLQGADPVPTPQPYALGDLSAVPNPALNPGFIYGNGSTKSSLNNFGIPAVVLGQALIPQTGNWSLAGLDPRFNPFYGRLAYPGTGSTIIGDAAAAGGSFFLFWLGMDDFLLHAAYGGDATKAPLTLASDFAFQYSLAIGSLLGSNPNLKGVVANFPDIFVMPYFTSVPYNPIPLDAATAGAVNAGFAGYNAALDGLVANKTAFGIPDALVAEINSRKISFAAGLNNSVVLIDETLTDLGPFFDGLQGVGAITAIQRAQLAPYQKVRQSTPTDVIPLIAGSILGTLVNNDPTLVNGVSVPLADQYVLIPSEISAINNARISFNSAIATTVSANSDRLALADVSSAMAELVKNKAAVMNGVTITPNINPPTGIYSEDGIHPNSRGYAFLSTVIISAINDKFTSAIPLTDISLYQATALPIP